MSNKMFVRLVATVFLGSILYAATSCNESTILGQSLVSSSEHVNTLSTDTFTVKAQTYYRPDDSLIANFQTQMEAGAITGDPVFGRTTAITYSQFGLSSPAFTFTGTNPTLDSAVLSYRYAGYYGDSLSQQSYTVYRINDPTFSDTVYYYLHQQIPIDHTPLGTVTVSPYSLQDSVNVNGTMEPPELRIKLNSAFGQELMQQSATGAFTNDSAFHKLLNGLALVPDSTTAGRRSIIYLALNSAYTGITVFYHNSTTDSLQAYFPFNVQTCAFTEYVRRDYTGSEAAMHFGDTTSTQGDSLIYLQSSPGLFANISIPYLQNFPNAIINKAELIITQIPDANASAFAAPNYLFLYKYYNPTQDSLGYVYDAGAIVNPLTHAVQFSNLSYFDGTKKIITNAQGQQVAQYRINITRDLQHLISNNPSYPEYNYGFRLVVMDASGQSIDPGRVVLGGGNNANCGIKLHVVYTKIQ